MYYHHGKQLVGVVVGQRRLKHVCAVSVALKVDSGGVMERKGAQRAGQRGAQCGD